MTQVALAAPVAQAVLVDLGLVVLRVTGDLQVVAAWAGADVSRWSDEAAVGRSLLELFPEFVGFEADLAATAGRREPRLELPLINRPAPGAIPGRYLTLTVLPDPEGEGCLLVLVQDVSEQGNLVQEAVQQRNELRLLRAQLEAANARLVRLDADKSAFLRAAAHDLRAPLAVVHGYVEMVLGDSRCRLTRDASESLEVVLRRTRGMARLIGDLLDVERIEAGEAGLSLAPVDVAALVEQVALDLAPLARQKGLALEWRVDPELPAVQGDRERLAQALANLVDNAVKFTPAGGRISVCVSACDGGVCVEVADDGPGISGEDQARLFQRFFRGERARSERIPGTGLGLSIVRAVVEQHAGRVFCRSRLGEGSTFGFALPAVPAPE